MTDLHTALAEAERQLRLAGAAFLAAHAEIAELRAHLAAQPAEAFRRERDTQRQAAAATPNGAAVLGNAGASARSALAGWTVARVEALRLAWTSGQKNDAILATLGALKGPPLGWQAVKAKAFALGLGRRTLPAKRFGHAPLEVAEIDTSAIPAPPDHLLTPFLSLERAKLLTAM